LSWTVPLTAFLTLIDSDKGENIMATQLGDFTVGQILTAADLNDIAVWTDYTPAFASGVTVGNGTWVAAYAIVNEILFWQGTFTLGSTSAITGAVTITLPASKTFPSPDNGELIGNCANESSQGLCSTNYGGVREASTTTVSIFVFNASSTYLSGTGLVCNSARNMGNR
jgi:hypothetical protein